MIKNAFIIIANGTIEETGVAAEQETFDLRNSLREVVDGERLSVELLGELVKRGLVESKAVTARKVSITSAGTSAKKMLASGKIKRVYDVEAPVPEIFLGKEAPYMQFLKQIRAKLVALGFKEMYSPLIVPDQFFHHQFHKDIHLYSLHL